MIIATNDMQEAEELCDRAAIINRGTVKICEPLPNIKAMIGHKGQYVFRIRGTHEQVKRKLNGYTFHGISISLSPDGPQDGQVSLNVKMENGKRELAEITKLLMETGMDIVAFYPEEYTLNEVFAKIVG